MKNLKTELGQHCEVRECHSCGANPMRRKDEGRINLVSCSNRGCFMFNRPIPLDLWNMRAIPRQAEFDKTDDEAALHIFGSDSSEYLEAIHAVQDENGCFFHEDVFSYLKAVKFRLKGKK